MDTGEIMDIALEMAGMEEIPADSGIYVEAEDIRRALFSIDVGIGELLLARQLGCDVVISHHPVARDTPLRWYRVIERHRDFMVEKGVPDDVARRAVEQLMERFENAAYNIAYGSAVKAAEAMKMPLMNVHLPCDELGRRRIVEQIPKAKDVTVGQVVQKLEELPEFKLAETRVEVVLGSRDAPAGEVAVAHGAGTNGGYPVAKAYFEHGVSTVMYIRIEYGELKRLRDEDVRGNLIVLGHTPTDSLGINPFISRLREAGIEVLTLGVIEAP